MARPGYSESEGYVVLAMELQDYQSLLLALGYVAGRAMEHEGPLTIQGAIGLVNRLNEGNPRFIPYKVPPRGKANG